MKTLINSENIQAIYDENTSMMMMRFKGDYKCLPDTLWSVESEDDLESLTERMNRQMTLDKTTLSTGDEITIVSSREDDSTYLHHISVNNRMLITMLGTIEEGLNKYKDVACNVDNGLHEDVDSFYTDTMQLVEWTGSQCIIVDTPINFISNKDEYLRFINNLKTE